MKKEQKLMRDYCLICDKDVDIVITSKNMHYQDEIMNIDFEGKVAMCPHCHEEIYNDEIEQYNQKKIYEKYIIENEIITKNEIEEILVKYNIGKRPLSLLLDFGEITITRYLNGYVPTPKNSKILKDILFSPSNYYSILQMNKNKIKPVAYNRSDYATKKILGLDKEDNNIFEVAKYIINKIEVTNLSLQKILYYIQMFYMAFYDKPAFTNKCGAWEYGPVFGIIYYKYKKFKENFIIDCMPTSEIDPDLKSIIDNVLKYFGCFSGNTLVFFTHKEELWKKGYESQDKIIEKDDILNFGKKIIREYNISRIEEINKYSQALYHDWTLN